MKKGRILFLTILIVISLMSNILATNYIEKFDNLDNLFSSDNILHEDGKVFAKIQSHTELGYSNDILLKLNFNNNILDSSSYSHTVNDLKSISFSESGKFFQAGLFNSQCLKISHNDNIDLNTRDEFSISFWFNKNTGQISGEEEYILIKRSGLTGIHIRNTGSTIDFAYSDGNWHTTQIDVIDYFDGKWHNLVANYNKNGNLAIYIDGAHIRDMDISKFTNPIGSSDIFIGCEGTSKYFNGMIDEFVIFDRLLSVDEIVNYGDYTRGVLVSKEINAGSVIANLNKISWKGTNNINVEISKDKNEWFSVVNGQSSNFELGLLISSLYYRVTLKDETEYIDEISFEWTDFVTQKVQVGMNIQQVNYWSVTQPIFTDLMKSVGDWRWGTFHSFGNRDNAIISYDLNGYPTYSPQKDGADDIYPIGIFNHGKFGDYVLIYDGVGQVEVKRADGNSISTGKGENKVYFTLNDEVLGNSTISYIRIISSQQGDNVRNIRIIPLEYEYNEENMPTFISDFLKGLEPFSFIRPMETMQINDNPGNDVIEWSDRPLSTDFGQATDKGVSLDHMVELSNILQTDLWICVPASASDDYIKQLALYLKNNLDPNLKVYVEYSNEVWNSIFPQSGWLRNNAIDHVNSYVVDDLREIQNLYDDKNWQECEVASPPYWNSACDAIFQKSAYMHARVWNIFNSIYKDEMESRVVKVAASFLTMSYSSRYMLEYFNEVAGIMPDALSPSLYFGFSRESREYLNSKAVTGSVTVQDILNRAKLDLDKNIKPQIEAHAEYATIYDLDLIAYEAGQHLDWRGDDVDSDGDGDKFNDPEDGWVQALYDSQISEGMYDLYIEIIDYFESIGGDGWGAYEYASPRESIHGSWGHIETYDQLYLQEDELKISAPKWAALMDYMQVEQNILNSSYFNEIKNQNESEIDCEENCESDILHEEDTNKDEIITIPESTPKSTSESKSESTSYISWWASIKKTIKKIFEAIKFWK